MCSCHSSHHCTALEKCIVFVSRCTTPTYFLLLVVVKNKKLRSAGPYICGQCQQKINWKNSRNFSLKILGIEFLIKQLELNTSIFRQKNKLHGSCGLKSTAVRFESGKKNGKKDAAPTLLNHHSGHHCYVSPASWLRSAGFCSCLCADWYVYSSCVTLDTYSDDKLCDDQLN
jgi:hypothetical protein